MMTIEQVKTGLIETLDSMDKDKLSLSDLQLYANILKTISEIQTKSYAESFAETFSALGGGFGGMKPTTISELK